MIRANGISKSFGDFKALDNLELNAEKGSVYGLIGPNGAGKTTFIKCLTGVYRPDCGTLKVDGEDVYEGNVKQRMTYIGDELYFFHGYSIKELAKYYSGIYENWSWDVYNKLRGIFKLDDKRKLRRLSKGMQKQAAFWIGISTCPEIMILDEPVDGLDPVMRKSMWSVVLDLVAEKNITVLVSSHNLRELEDVCDHVGIMFNGKIVIEKSLDDVRGNIHKLQLAFKEGVPDDLRDEFSILHESSMGSIVFLIVKGDTEDIKRKIEKYNPLVMDIVPLTLEEVFIYELGGMGYEVKSVIS